MQNGFRSQRKSSCSCGRSDRVFISWRYNKHRSWMTSGRSIMNEIYVGKCLARSQSAEGIDPENIKEIVNKSFVRSAMLYQIETCCICQSKIWILLRTEGLMVCSMSGMKLVKTYLTNDLM